MDWITLLGAMDPLDDHLSLADNYLFRRLRAQHDLVLYMLLLARMTS